MEKFTEGLRRFAMAGVGAVSLAIEKSKEVIDQLAERGEITASDSRAARDELQQKMTAQLDAFTKKLKADYENASFEQMLSRCDSLTPEQKARLIERLTAPAEKNVIEYDEPAETEAAAETPAEAAAPEAPAAPANGDTPAEE